MTPTARSEDTTMQDRLLTPPQVAEILRVNVTTLEAWRGRRIGPAWIKLGDGKRGAIRYRQSEIDAYLQRSTVQTDS